MVVSEYRPHREIGGVFLCPHISSGYLGCYIKLEIPVFRVFPLPVLFYFKKKVEKKSQKKCDIKIIFVYLI